MQPQLWSVSALANELALDRRTVAKRLVGVPPAGERSGNSVWRLSDALPALTEGRRSEAPPDEVSDKARLMKAKADIAEMEAERLAGDLVPTAEVEAAWTEIMARVRARMLAVPSRAAPMAIGQPSIEAAHEVIETFVHEALAELAATEVDGIAAAGGGDAPGAEDDGPASEAENIGVG